MGDEGKIIDGAASGGEGEKSYSEAEFNAELEKRVSEAVKSEKAKWQAEYDEKLKTERDEAAKYAKMNAAEREKADFDKRVDEFNKKEAKYNAERLEFECTKQLASEKLPVEMASILTGADADSTKANVETFKAAFAKAVEAGVTEKLKGKAPVMSNESMSDSWLENVRKGEGLK